MPPDPTDGFHPEFALLAAGLKSVVKLERVPRGGADARLSALRARGLAAVRHPERRYGWGGADDVGPGDAFTTLLVALDESLAREAADCDLLEASSAPSVDRLAASRRLGALLGYPPCCVAAYADAFADPRLRAAGDLGHLLPLNRTVRPLDPRLNRVGAARPLLSHHPCRLDCAASAAIGQAVLDALAALDPDAAVRALADLSRPTLWWGSSAIALHGGWDGDVFRLTGASSGGRRGGADPTLLAALSEADGLRARFGAVQLLRSGVPLVELGGSVGTLPRLFDWTGTHRPWLAAPAAATEGPLLEPLRAQGLPVREGEPEEGDLPIDPRASLAEALRAVEARFDRPRPPWEPAPKRLDRPAAPPSPASVTLGALAAGGAVGGFRVLSVAPLGDAARVLLADDLGSLAIRLGPEDPRARFRCGELAVVYERTDRPLDLVERAVAAVVAAAGPALDGGTADALRRWLAAATSR